jgi:6-phosphogluconolactonase (cycloisomerase 2 family)
MTAVLGVVTLCWTTGCAGFWVAVGNSSGGSTSTTNDYVYVANANSTSTTKTMTLAGFAVGTGTLTAIPGSPYTLPFYPTAVAVNPANTIVFVAGNSEILAYAIQSDGSLSTLNGGGAVGYAAVASMDISPDGQWLIALDQNNITMDEFEVNSTTGLLTAVLPLTTYPVLTGATTIARAVKFSPNGDYLFAALGTAGYVVYTFNTSSGALTTPLTPLSLVSGTSANALAVSPNSQYLYVAMSGTGGGLAAYTISGSNGALTSVSGSPFTAGTQPFSVVVNNAGTGVYLANRGDNTISEFGTTANSSSQLPTLGTIASGSAVTALAVDNSGDYLLAAANGGSADLTMYSYDSTTVGKLDFSTSATTGTDPTGPVAIATTH